MASSANTDIATAWNSKDADGSETQINENQELLNDWKDEKRPAFYFYQQKFNIVLRDTDDGAFLVCSKGKTVCIARQFKTIWFICAGDTSKDQKKIKAKQAFGAARSAFSSICGAIFDSLEEAGV